MNDSSPGSQAPSWFLWAVVLQGGLVLAFVLLWIGMAARGEFWRSDFTAFYVGWRIVLEGNGERLYDRAMQEEYQEKYVPERTAEGGLLAFVNPPHAALAMAPLAYLPREAAFYAWTLFQLGFLLAVFWYFLEWTSVWPFRDRLLLVLSVLAFPPLLMTFQLGQVSLAGLLCLTGFFRELKRGNDVGASAWLVLGTFKPQLMVIPAVALLAGRRWRGLAWSALMLGLWAALTMAVMGWRCWLAFLEITRHNAQQFGTDGISPLRMYNLKGFLTALLEKEQATLINGLTAAGLLLALAAAAWIWRKPWQGKGLDLELRAALSMQLGLLGNPHLNPADALCYVLPAILFLTYLRQDGRPWQSWAIFLLCWPWLFIFDNFMLMDRAGGFRPFFLLMAASAAWMVREATLQPRRSSP